MSPARRLATIVAVGLATGALTQLGQGILPGDWSQAANAISPWLLVAFLLGSTMPDRRWAGVAGIGAPPERVAVGIAGWAKITGL